LDANAPAVTAGMALKLLSIRSAMPKHRRNRFAHCSEHMIRIPNFGNLRLRESTTKRIGTACAVLAYVFVWFCLIKLPATGFRDSPPQSWEGVLAYAAAHRLQWGRDIVFTFGPLGFLTSDYYWGYFFWPIMLWAGAFALAIATVLAPSLRRLPIVIRLPLYAALPLLTVPSCSALGFDSIHFLSITLLGIACLPAERPGTLRLITTGLIFTVLSLIKFTFCIYSVYTLAVIAISNHGGHWRNTGILAASSLLSLLAICWWMGQAISSIFLYAIHGAQLAAGYSAAMGISASGHDPTMGIALLIFVVALVITSWLGSANWRNRTDRAAIVAAGTFLAWKEGFVRADVHVVVFFVFAFILAALTPALLGLDWAQDEPNQIGKTLLKPAGNSLFRRRVLTLSAGCMFLSMTPLAIYKSDFRAAVRSGLVARNADTFKAFLRPSTFKRQLTHKLETMRGLADLPKIRAVVGRDSVDALNLDQDLVILNELNYVPHPVFQSYSAFTPALQRLNAAFFSSAKTPEYLLWRAGSIDGRFPTLDDGEVLVKLLTNYSPSMEERGIMLWKRKTAAENSYCFANPQETTNCLEQWIPVPSQPTWLRIDCRQTFPGAMQSLLWRGSELRFEVQLDNGAIRNYRLLPGNARSGFVISPFLYCNDRLLETAHASASSPVSETAPLIPAARSPKIVAARVLAANDFAFARTVRFTTETIRGILPSRNESPPTESKGISSAQ
jgi:hypothetical protein